MQRTLKTQISVVGVGLHTGQRLHLRVQPAAADAGITFVRDDLAGASIHLDESTCITRGDHATTLSGDGFSISTVEHLLAALRGMGVDNARIRVSGDEIPIMDGSAAPFVYLIKEAGVRSLGLPRRVIRLNRPVAVLDDDREVTIYPADDFRVTYTIDFSHPSIGNQTLTRTINSWNFVNEIAPARTFCLLKDVQALRERGLALGGSLANAVVIGDAGPLNSLRFHDEFVRHKILDLVGDFSLMGHPIMGHVVAYKAGHAIHARLVRQLQVDPGAWTLTTLQPPSVIAGAHVASIAQSGVARRASLL